MEPGLRTRFVRSLVESMHAGAQGTSVSELRARLPERLGLVLTEEILAPGDPTHAISLDDAEALLFEIEAVMGDGSGRTLEEAGRGLAARVLTEGTERFAASDVLSAVRRLEAPLEQAVVGARLQFEVVAKDDGFILTLGIAGRPRFARLLRHVATGYIQSAATGSGTSASRLTMRAETLGDRGRIVAVYRAEDGETTVPAQAAASRRRASTSLRVGRLTEEIDRILGASSRPSTPPRRPRE